ncbi:hypothetical protein FSP39_018450 [Pinctada imbricata]|uniref:Uncharacterized protein n=1 Tax=Pinctada imbricata TaxID=66713 RepID=A0AA88YLM6_PINIB|nr:hypothetical protein FSP39_018450 [Pinctada imbricata]
MGLNVVEEENCKEHINIAFVKVHKAGSTTLQNILQRFGHRRNLSFVLSNMSDTSKPAGMRHYLGYEGTIDFKSLLPLPKGRDHFNILSNHVVFNHSVFSHVMPSSTSYIGIVREPLSQLRSTMAYYGYGNNWKLENNETVLTHYLNSPEKYKVTYLFSRMSYDFGLPQRDVRNMTSIRSFIQDLDKVFKFVLILEYFDESLVLLKRLLCWTLRDIIYILVNKSNRKIPYAMDDFTKHKNIAVADYEIYSHFYEKFWQLVSKELNNGFAQEVGYFKNLLQRVLIFCDSGTQVLRIPNSEWSNEFSITREDCRLMTLHEVYFIQMLTKKQYLIN